jgi:hypothetical protein
MLRARADAASRFDAPQHEGIRQWNGALEPVHGPDPGIKPGNDE